MTGKRVVALLGLVILVTILLILFLVFRPKSTIVELRLTVLQMAFSIPNPVHPANSIPLFPPSLKARSLLWRGKGVDSVELILSEPVGQVVKTKTNSQSKIHLKGDGEFYPLLELYQASDLVLSPSGPDSLKIIIKEHNLTLSGENSETTSWKGTAEAEQQLRLRYKGLEVPLDPEINVLQDRGWSSVNLANEGQPIEILGGHGRAELDLQLVSEKPQPSARLQILDLSSGHLSEPKWLSVELPEDQVISQSGDRLFLLDKKSTDHAGTVLFRTNLNIQKPKFFKLKGFEEESFLLSGKIRFPGGEREDVNLENGFLLELEVDELSTLKLKSIHFKDGRFELHLWGKPSSITMGPTKELMTELLPSYFAWLYTHQLGTLAFSTVVWIAGAFITFLKLVGRDKT